MEEEAPSRRSVAELAGKFRGTAAPHDATGNEAEKPVRRRPPRTLKLPKPDGDDQEPPPGINSLPGKAKRNSALIEKLQANLALSPTALLPSPKSPGFRLLPPAFPPSSHAADPITSATTPSTATPTTPVTTSPMTEEEGPASFEDPPAGGERSILSSFNKGRARHSVRRRPPSRRHRKSSSGDDLTNEGADTLPSSTSQQDSNTTDGGGGEGGGEEEEKTECPNEEETHKDDQTKKAVELRGAGEEKKEEEEEEGEDGEEVKTEVEDQEKNPGGKQGEEKTSTQDKEEEKNEETTCRVQPGEESDIRLGQSAGATGPSGDKAEETPEGLDTRL